jgi:hypothetical protein
MGHDYPIEGADNSLFPPLVGGLTAKTYLKCEVVAFAPEQVHVCDLVDARTMDVQSWPATAPALVDGSTKA